MATGINEFEFKQISRYMKKIVKDMTPESAKNLLMNTGMYNKKGELISPYNGNLLNRGLYCKI